MIGIVTYQFGADARSEDRIDLRSVRTVAGSVGIIFITRHPRILGTSLRPFDSTFKAMHLPVLLLHLPRRSLKRIVGKQQL